MIREFKIGRFPGFYESVLSYSEEFIDWENDLECEMVELYDLNENDVEVEINYTENGFQQFMLQVSSETGQLIIDSINSKYNLDIKCVGTEVSSPNYYNFETDKGFIAIEIEGYQLVKIKDIVFNEYYNDFDKLLKEHYTSYDGFHSFYSNDIETWHRKNIYEYDYNELGTLIEMLHIKYIDNESWLYTLSEISECKYEYIENEYSYKDKTGLTQEEFIREVKGSA